MSTQSVNFRKVYLLFDQQENLHLIERVAANSRSQNRPLVVSDRIKIDDINRSGDSAVVVVTQNAVNRFLGQELNDVFYDASASFDVNAFAAITGCIVGGGHLFMLLPESLTNFQSLGIEQLAVDGLLSNCVTRLLYNFRKISSDLKSDVGDDFSISETNNELPPALSLSDEFLGEQAKAIEQIKRVSLGHAKRPLVITAARGRGKSTALGLAVADLIFERKKEILVTAPRKRNLQIFYQHFEKRLKKRCDDSAEKANLHLYDELKTLLAYRPPDELITFKNTNQLVIVEEAGAIPVQMLEKISNLTTRCIYSTTTDGYEGNGQGFELRFKPFLNDNFKQLNLCRLVHPARFIDNDPLEEAINKALLFSNKPINFVINNFSMNKIIYRKVDQQELRKNNILLEKIYNLLLIAHYQTRPSDLERILSNPNLSVFVAAYDDHVLCASLIVKEGLMSAEQCSLVDRGDLRLPGHLIPQSMMAHQGINNAGRLGFWRFMRITTNSDFRNRQIASSLIKFIVSQAIKSSVDMLATSFALDQQMIQFWYKQNFLCNRIGIRKDSSTGKFSSEFVRLIATTKKEVEECHQLSLSQFSSAFFHTIRSRYLDVSPFTLIQIIIRQIANPENTQLSTNSAKKESGIDQNSCSEQEIKRYLQKARSFEMVEWHLYQCVISDLINPTPRTMDLTDQRISLLCRKILQQVSWKELVLEHGFVGKKAAQSALRESIAYICQA